MIPLLFGMAAAAMQTVKPRHPSKGVGTKKAGTLPRPFRLQNGPAAQPAGLGALGASLA